jgi:hypothetical protein
MLFGQNQYLNGNSSSAMRNATVDHTDNGPTAEYDLESIAVDPDSYAANAVGGSSIPVVPA